MDHQTELLRLLAETDQRLAEARTLTVECPAQWQSVSRCENLLQDAERRIVRLLEMIR